MRILMINHFPLEGSGSGTYTKNLAMQLVACGHEVCIILPEIGTDYPRYEGVRLHPVLFTAEDATPAKGALPFNFPCFTTHPRSTTTFGELSQAQMKAYLDAFEAAIDEEIERFAPDIIHGQHVWMLPSLAAGKGVPLVLTAHGTDLMGCEKWPSMRPYAEAAIDACARVICISKDNEELVRAGFPEQADKVVPMRNGYNPAIIFPQALDAPQVLAPYGVNAGGKRIVLFAGKLTDFKGVDVLIDAVALYEDDLPDVITLIAGDGVLRSELDEQARRLGLRSLTFLGNVDQDELCRLYNIASVDVVPSRREPFGLVAVEAMACGTPVVATDEGGLSDFVNDQVGALVPVGDAASLANAIRAVLQRRSEDASWPDAIVSYAQAYSQAAIIRDIETMYHAVLDERASR